MRHSIAAVDENSLKDYAVIIYGLEVLPESKITLALNKLKSSRSEEEKREVEAILIENHLRLAFTTAAKYRGCGFSFAKLICVANRGLIKAIKEWNPEGEDNFYSYLAWHIEGELIKRILATKNKIMKNKG